MVPLLNCSPEVGLRKSVPISGEHSYVCGKFVVRATGPHHSCTPTRDFSTNMLPGGDYSVRPQPNRCQARATASARLCMTAETLRRWIRQGAVDAGKARHRVAGSRGESEGLAPGPHRRPGPSTRLMAPPGIAMPCFADISTVQMLQKYWGAQLLRRPFAPCGIQGITVPRRVAIRPRSTSLSGGAAIRLRTVRPAAGRRTAHRA